jgi:hypothetical protein
VSINRRKNKMANYQLKPRNFNLERGIDNLHKVLKEAEYGKEFSWADLSKMAKTILSKPQLYYVVNQVGERLEEQDHRVLVTSRGVGKRIINPSEHIVVATKLGKKSARIYTKALKKVNATNLDLLSPEEQKATLLQADRFKTMKLFADEMLKSKKIGKVTSKDNQTASLFLDVVKLLTKSEKKEAKV